MHFTYSEPQGDLKQGDLLRRTSSLEDLLRDVHPHYKEKQANKYFIVLTQSCDLVRRTSHDPCKSRHLSLAPVRPLSLLLERYLAENQVKDVRVHSPVCTERFHNQL